MEIDITRVDEQSWSVYWFAIFRLPFGQVSQVYKIKTVVEIFNGGFDL